MAAIGEGQLSALILVEAMGLSIVDNLGCGTVCAADGEGFSTEPFCGETPNGLSPLHHCLIAGLRQLVRSDKRAGLPDQSVGASDRSHSGAGPTPLPPRHTSAAAIGPAGAKATPPTTRANNGSTTGYRKRLFSASNRARNARITAHQSLHQADRSNVAEVWTRIQ